MRSASLLGGLALTALFGLAGAARTDPYVATIQVDQTDARAGRGDGAMFYPTNRFRVGDRVRVLREEDGGWLAIAPPSGSFSWIRKDQLYIDTRQQPSMFIVNAEAADVRIGSALTADPPLVIGKRVARGTIVTPLPNGLEKADKDGVWLPIVPPDGEARYIRTESVQKPAANPTDRQVGVITVPPAGSPAAAQTADALYKQAVEAEKWNPQEAITLYNQGANSDANPDRRIQALNRANWLRDNLRNPAQTLVPGPPPGADLRVATAPSESKVYPLTADSGPTPSVRLAPPQGSGAPTVAASNAFSATPTSYSDPSTPRAPAGPIPASGKTYSTGPGVLRSSGRPAIEGRKAYLMYTDKNVPFYYVTDWTGGDLEKYLNRRVELSGEAITSGELRMNYMRASHVELREGQ